MAFTLLELLLVILIIAILAGLLLPVLEKARGRSRQIECLSQLKQTGLGYHSFAHEHQDGFPFQVAANQGGTFELTQAGERTGADMGYTFRHFQALSNDLETPRILRCAADARNPAATFEELQNINLSYFAGVTATYQQPNSILGGDRNLTTEDGASGSILHFGGGTGGSWTRDGHDYQGNLLFADGHVERAPRSRLKEGFSSVRLSAWIPVGSPKPGPAFAANNATLPPPPAPPASGGNGGRGGATSPGANNTAFAILQNYFQAPASPGSPSVPPSNPEVAALPAATENRPAPARAGAAPAVPAAPAATPIMPPAPAMTNAPTHRVAAPAPAPAVTPDPANAAQASEEPPVNLLVVFTKPDRCWYCWVIILLLAMSTALLLGLEVRRKRRQQRARDILAG